MAHFVCLKVVPVKRNAMNGAAYNNRNHGIYFFTKVAVLIPFYSVEVIDH
jgi:hypothetical protein